MPPPLPTLNAPTVTPPPLPGAAAPTSPTVPPDVLRVLRLTLAAARADGSLEPRERDAILTRAKELGAEALMTAELDAPRPLADVVGGVVDMQARRDLYTLGFAIVRADETVTDLERTWLTALADQLRLGPTDVGELEQQAASRIAAAAEGGRTADVCRPVVHGDEWPSGRPGERAEIAVSRTAPRSRHTGVHGRHDQLDELRLVPKFAQYFKTGGAKRRRRCPGSAPQSHEIDFEIFGDEMQFVEVELDPGESAVAEAGAMMYMTHGIEMETIFGDGSRSSSGGVMDALLGAGKRLLTGESLFMTVFTNTGSGKQQRRVRRALSRQDPPDGSARRSAAS